MLRGRRLTFALLAALATLATVLAKTAVLAGPLVAGALLGWLFLFRRARVAWLDDGSERWD